MKTGDLDTFFAWTEAEYRDNPGNKAALIAYAETLAYMGRNDDKLAVLNEGSVLHPKSASIQIAIGIEWLTRGEYAKGWPHYLHRKRTYRNDAEKQMKLPPDREWKGEPVEGSRILVLWEQGLGDTIHFIRGAIDLQRLGARPLLDVQSPLRPVMAASPALGLALSGGAKVAPNLWIRMLDMVPLISPTAAQIRWPGAYISAPAIAEPILPLAGRASLRVGLAWTGSADFPMNDIRSVPLAALAPLRDCARCDFYSLMLLPVADQIAAEGFQDWITDLSPVAQPFDRLAGVISQLDVVVTMCTSIAHLAGAMGKPTFLMLSTMGEWRWGRDSSTTPWYPSMRLFRQPRFGDWDSVVAEVCEALEAL
ncbi:MAG: hypothetical protein AAGB15_04675 [Pseudomonadota bacterium]